MCFLWKFHIRPSLPWDAGLNIYQIILKRIGLRQNWLLTRLKEFLEWPKVDTSFYRTEKSAFVRRYAQQQKTGQVDFFLKFLYLWAQKISEAIIFHEWSTGLLLPFVALGSLDLSLTVFIFFITLFFRWCSKSTDFSKCHYFEKILSLRHIFTC